MPDLIDTVAEMAGVFLAGDADRTVVLRDQLLDAEVEPGLLYRAPVILGAAAYQAVADAMNADPMNMAVFNVVFNPFQQANIISVVKSSPTDAAQAMYNEVRQPRGYQPQILPLYFDFEVSPKLVVLTSGFEALLTVLFKYSMATGFSSFNNTPAEYIERVKALALQRLSLA
ncbi:hypothetical protein RhoFasGS6_03933 [Rhodococcus fascians]|nr:hypothetical protein [Rhodococcus fascians]